MDPQLSHYTQFFIVITNLNKTNLITSEQKSHLKTTLMKKDEGITKVLLANSGPGKEMQLREALLQYLSQQQVQKSMQRRRSHKSKTVHFEQHPEEQPVVSQEEIKNETLQHPLSSCAFLMIEQLSQVLSKHLDKYGTISKEDERTKLIELKQLIGKLAGNCNDIVDDKVEIENLSPLRARFSSENSRLAEISEREQDSSDEDVYERILKQIQLSYRELKGIFTGNLHTHLLLMQEDISYENLYQVLKFLLKTLTDADEFSFFIRREHEWEVYSTATDSIRDCLPEEAKRITEELAYLRPLKVHKVQTKQKHYPQIEETSKAAQYVQTSIVKFQLQQQKSDTLFCFHWADKDKKNIKRKFINYANMYQFNKEVSHLAQFLVETIITAKVQFFNSLRFADQVQDIGICFMRISRFLLMEGIKKALMNKYVVDKEQTFSTDENIRQLHEQQQNARIEMKDANPVTLIVKGMDLLNEADKHLFQEIIRLQERYDGYVKLCYEKSAFYKYFLRTNDSLLFDFDKLGELIFLSRPISQSLKERYNLQFDPKTILYNKVSYQEIFAQSGIISNIEVNIQNIHENRRNQYLSNQENPQFEIFLKVVENDFKGFTVIFHQNETSRLRQQFKTLRMDNMSNDVQKEAENNRSLEEDIQRSIQKQYNKHQTFKFLNQLDQISDVGNSMIALFIPENELNQIKHRKSNPQLQVIKQESSSANSPSPQSDHRHEFASIQQQQRKYSKMSSRHFIKYSKSVDMPNYQQFVELEKDSQLDTFSFNILEETDSQEKQRIVYSILEKNGFIDEYSIPLNILSQFLGVLQRKYNKRKNSFHNYDHGIAVMQSTHFLCSAPKARQFIDKFRRMATIVSALCHDVSHTARTNMYMINSQSKLATRYHDQSPLEQHHAATTIFMLKDPNQNFLCNIDKEHQMKFRRILIDNILYTDIKVHFALLKDFESRIKEDNAKAFGEGDDDLKLLTGMIVHTADFNGGAKQFDVSRVWSEKVNKEFSAQYEEEGNLGIAQTPFLKDLDKIHIMAKSEMGFFKVIVRPLWFTINQFMDGFVGMSITNLDNTIISWEKIYHANVPKEEIAQIK